MGVWILPVMSILCGVDDKKYILLWKTILSSTKKLHVFIVQSPDGKELEECGLGVLSVK